jgi:hypothetical protein
MLLAAVPEPGSPLLDLGSGAGVPGLIIKLARPAWEVALLEASRRRANFLRSAVRALDVPVDVHQGRAEELGAGALARRFRTVTMRAVAPEPAGGRLARPFLAAGGVLVVTIGPAERRRRGRIVAIGGREGLPWGRRFLIIPQAELDGDVSRGTLLGARAVHRRREPEGRRGQDHDRSEPGGGPGPR